MATTLIIALPTIALFNAIFLNRIPKAQLVMLDALILALVAIAVHLR